MGSLKYARNDEVINETSYFEETVFLFQTMLLGTMAREYKNMSNSIINNIRRG